MSRTGKITALYCRLSQDDEKQGDSMSIQNQKILLEDYATRNGFGNIEFFIDDGFSGVHVERREALQRLIACVEANMVSTVITKDLSRLGRNYLLMGQLIEITFPEHGVRYIAIHDNVDTERDDNEFTPIKNWVNEYYARDASKKVRAVQNAKAKRGERVSGLVPYGYIHDPNDRNRLIPDPDAAHVVKQIFAMYVDGARISDIQAWLRDNEIPTVGELRYRRTGKTSHDLPQLGNPYDWPNKTIYDILARREYLGHTYTNKSHKVSFKSRKVIKHPEEEHYVFLNTHKPLVDQSTFDLAKKRASTRNRPTKTGEIDIFSGILFCADCGYKLYTKRGSIKSPGDYAYTCGNYRNAARRNTICTAHYIRKAVLVEIVAEDLNRVMEHIRSNEADFVSHATKYGDQTENKSFLLKKKDDDKATARISELDNLFRKAYEDFALGRITEPQFNMLTSCFDEERGSLTSLATALEEKIASYSQRKADVAKFVKVVKKHTHIDELTYENVHEFINQILVHETSPETNTRKVEIHYSFIGPLENKVAM